MRSFLRDFLLALSSRRVLVCAAIALAAGVAIWALVPSEQRMLGFILLAAALAMAVMVAGLAIGLSQSANAHKVPDHSGRITQLAAQIERVDINIARIAARLEHVAVEGSAPMAIAIDTVSQRLNAIENDMTRAQTAIQRLGFMAASEDSAPMARAIDIVSQRLNALENDVTRAQTAIERFAIVLASDAVIPEGVLAQLRAGIETTGARLGAIESAYDSIARDFDSVSVRRMRSDIDSVAARLSLTEDQMLSHATNVEKIVRQLK